MNGGLCPRHGTPMNGFGNMTFCNACDAEDEAQNTYEADRESSLEEQHYLDEKDCATPGPYGYIIFGNQQPCGQRGTVAVPANKEIYTTEPTPGTFLGAVYRVRLMSVPRYQTSRTTYRVRNETQAYAEQILYKRDGYRYVGAIKCGTWDCPDP